MADLITASGPSGVPVSSPLESHIVAGEFGNLAYGARVTLAERCGLAICDVQAWPGNTTRTARAIGKATGLPAHARGHGVGTLGQAFQYSPDRWTVIANQAELAAVIANAVGDGGSVVDLSHGRVVLRLAGEKSRWVLAKLFAIDFALSAFPVGRGIGTCHHTIGVQIQRVDRQTFDLLAHRSLARALWDALTRAGEEVGGRVPDRT